MESLLGAFAPNIILILRSGMKKVIKRIFLGVFALMIFALGAGIISSYYFLEVSDYEFENEKIQESVKLVQLSDIHNAEFGKENQRLLKKLKECEPDLIFITGDLINSDENEISPMLDLVKKLREIAPIYFSLGNHEIEYEKRTGIDLTEKLEKAGAKVLEEKFVDVTVKGQKFRIGGLYTVYIPEDYEVHEWDNAKEQAEFLIFVPARPEVKFEVRRRLEEGIVYKKDTKSVRTFLCLFLLPVMQNEPVRSGL